MALVIESWGLSIENSQKNDSISQIVRSIPILVVKMPKIIPFPVYSQTGNGITTF